MSSNEDISPGRRWLTRLAWAAGALVILLVAARLALGAWANGRFEDAEAAWAGDPDYRAIAAMQPVEASDAARRVEDLADAVGIDIKPKTGGRPAPRFAAEFPQKSASEWMHVVVASGGAPLPEPPPDLRAFLAEHADGVDALAAQLATGDVPAWPTRVNEGFAAPIPNLLGHMLVMRLLLASALMDDAAGRADRAQAALDATWKLGESVGARPELICRLIHVAIVRQLAAVVRRIDGRPETWSQRFASLDLPASMHRAFAGEACGAAAFARTGQLADIGSDDDVAALPMLVLGRGAFMRASVAGHMLALHDIMRSLEAMDPCTADPIGTSAARAAQLAWWDVVAKIMLPNLDNAWARGLQGDIELGLTRAVLAARQARTAGAAPQAPLPLRCKAWSFREAPTPDGGFRIELDGKVPWSVPDASFSIPLSHVEAGPPASVAP